MASHNTKVSKDLNKYFLNEQIRALQYDSNLKGSILIQQP